MSENHQLSNSGKGSCRFRLGYGPGATGGILDVELKCFAAAEPAVSIRWLTPLEAMPAEARQQTIAFIESYLRGYLEAHPVGAIDVEVVDAGWFEDRRNEPERAAAVALHFAIVDAKLPPPLLYAPPEA